MTPQEQQLMDYLGGLSLGGYGRGDSDAASRLIAEQGLMYYMQQIGEWDPHTWAGFDPAMIDLLVSAQPEIASLLKLPQTTPAATPTATSAPAPVDTLGTQAVAPPIAAPVVNPPVDTAPVVDTPLTAEEQQITNYWTENPGAFAKAIGRTPTEASPSLTPEEQGIVDYWNNNPGAFTKATATGPTQEQLGQNLAAQWEANPGLFKQDYVNQIGQLGFDGGYINDMGNVVGVKDDVHSLQVLANNFQTQPQDSGRGRMDAFHNEAGFDNRTINTDAYLPHRPTADQGATEADVQSWHGYYNQNPELRQLLSLDEQQDLLFLDHQTGNLSQADYKKASYDLRNSFGYDRNYSIPGSDSHRYEYQWDVRDKKLGNNAYDSFLKNENTIGGYFDQKDLPGNGFIQDTLSNPIVAVVASLALPYAAPAVAGALGISNVAAGALLQAGLTAGAGGDLKDIVLAGATSYGMGIAGEALNNFAGETLSNYVPESEMAALTQAADSAGELGTLEKVWDNVNVLGAYDAYQNARDNIPGPDYTSPDEIVTPDNRVDMLDNEFDDSIGDFDSWLLNQKPDLSPWEWEPPEPPEPIEDIEGGGGGGESTDGNTGTGGGNGTSGGDTASDPVGQSEQQGQGEDDDFNNAWWRVIDGQVYRNDIENGGWVIDDSGTFEKYGGDPSKDGVYNDSAQPIGEGETSEETDETPPFWSDWDWGSILNGVTMDGVIDGLGTGVFTGEGNGTGTSTDIGEGNGTGTSTDIGDGNGTGDDDDQIGDTGGTSGDSGDGTDTGGETDGDTGDGTGGDGGDETGDGTSGDGEANTGGDGTGRGHGDGVSNGDGDEDGDGDGEGTGGGNGNGDGDGTGESIVERMFGGQGYFRDDDLFDYRTIEQAKPAQLSLMDYVAALQSRKYI